jgi:GNAT superfamily N-acetyltransferase
MARMDHVTSFDPEHAEYIRRAVDQHDVLVIEVDGSVAAYGVLTRGSFFARDFVDRLYTAEAHRRRGLGAAVLAALAERADGPRVFTSTNESNAPMQALLDRDGWKLAGRIDHLDPGDPELVYVLDRATP